MSSGGDQNLSMEVGRAQATARAVQEALINVEKHFTDRVDRLETRMDNGFDELDRKIDRRFSDVETLIRQHTSEVSDLKLKISHKDGEEKHKEESKSTSIAIWALGIAAFSAVLNVVGPLIVKYL